ncbi:superoxide dismutase [Gordonia hirsuta DSM 44140 = NBRC 16056]|uniref:Superoxide dismutase n=1 Tax=Gordonia hirsuta DSM 44140 = NBRC 16056 TaxID=1121927 RepID=L7L7X3_9ACTN|nr:hypothetical protein [Gordonia hirsuta]GAC56999.1 superoxide dismutase [Gordonia hirsuta DSM 44140 = NBRC 16056]
MTASLITGVTTKRVLATLAAAGIAGFGLTACTPDEHVSDVPGTNPAPITGNQVEPGDLVNADDVPAAPGSAVGTANLLSPSGDALGAASFVTEGNSTKVNLRVSGMTPGSHKVEVRSASSCFAPKEVEVEGGSPTAAPVGGFTNTGNVIAGGSLPGIAVNEQGNGSARQTVTVNVADLDGKIVVLLTGDTAVACGNIVAN